ncbi:hypothetical protein CR513_61399, partial [Mucuna pruriens]
MNDVFRHFFVFCGELCLLRRALLLYNSGHPAIRYSAIPYGFEVLGSTNTMASFCDLVLPRLLKPSCMGVGTTKWGGMLGSNYKALDSPTTIASFCGVVLSRLEVVCSATWLSHINFIAFTSPNLSCWSKCLSHVSSQIFATIARYSTFAFTLTIVFCLLLHEIKLPPTRMQYPKVDLLYDGTPT